HQAAAKEAEASHMTSLRCRLTLAAAISALAIASSSGFAQVPAPQSSQTAPAPPTAAPTPPAPAAAPTSTPAQAGADARPNKPPAVARLPGEITTIQYLEAPDRRFQFKATAGAIPLYDAADGSLQAEVAYVAYVKSDGGPARPVTFVFNGGPGAASAYLQLG